MKEVVLVVWHVWLQRLGWGMLVVLLLLLMVSALGLRDVLGALSLLVCLRMPWNACLLAVELIPRDWVHVAALRLVDSFVRALLLHQVVLADLVLLSLALPRGRCRPHVQTHLWVHGLLLSNALLLASHDLIDVGSVSSLLHQGIPRSHLTPAVRDLHKAGRRCRGSVVVQRVRDHIFEGVAATFLRGCAAHLVCVVGVADHWVNTLLADSNPVGF